MVPISLSAYHYLTRKDDPGLQLFKRRLKRSLALPRKAPQCIAASKFLLARRQLSDRLRLESVNLSNYR